jgi:hypothetical protein
VKTRWDDRWLFVESDGLPHEPWTYPLMVGIKSWQQQVPLPQDYTGSNAWQIPLKPELAETPISGKTHLYRGAIALAANGVPIFNARNNRGDDAFKVGELDEYGGHAGRGDDYHYHIAPLALQKVVGPDNPIAYALDGFPLYGLFDPAAKKTRPINVGEVLYRVPAALLAADFAPEVAKLLKGQMGVGSAGSPGDAKRSSTGQTRSSSTPTTHASPSRATGPLLSRTSSAAKCSRPSEPERNSTAYTGSPGGATA